MHWSNRYIGLPFADKGRDLKGVDCWGLVALVYARELNIQLSSYGDISASDLAAVAREMARDSAVEPWHALPDDAARRAFDVTVMKRRRAPIHVGVMTDPEHLLHIERGIDAVRLPLSHPSLQFRGIQFFRHRDLMQ